MTKLNHKARHWNKFTYHYKTILQQFSMNETLCGLNMNGSDNTSNRYKIWS